MAKFVSCTPNGAPFCEKVELNKLSNRLEATIVQPFMHTTTYTASSQFSLFPIPLQGNKQSVYAQPTRRVVFMPVANGTTVEMVNQKLASMPAACIYEVRANQPILSSEQAYMVSAGRLSRDTIAARQIARSSTTKLPALDAYGNPVFRVCYFSPEMHADVDMTAKTCLGIQPPAAQPKQQQQQPVDQQLTQQSVQQQYTQPIANQQVNQQQLQYGSSNSAQVPDNQRLAPQQQPMERQW